MDWKRAFTAWIFFIIGIFIFSLLMYRYIDDLVFYFTAEKKLVYVNDVRSVVQDVATDVTTSFPYYDVEISISTKVDGLPKYFIEHYQSTKEDINKHIVDREKLRHTKTWLYLSDRTPSYFATDNTFPTTRLLAMLTPLIVLILPMSTVFYLYYVKKFRD